LALRAKLTLWRYWSAAWAIVVAVWGVMASLFRLFIVNDNNTYQKHFYMPDDITPPSDCQARVTRRFDFLICLVEKPQYRIPLINGGAFSGDCGNSLPRFPEESVPNRRLEESPEELTNQ
jgi:hypothetical protein